MVTRVVLLDIDGVLVEPRGYRASTVATMDWFYRRWGWRAPLPPEGAMAAFEAQGITSEWDMVPLMLAWVAEALVQRWGPEVLPPMPRAAHEPDARPRPCAVMPGPFEDLPARLAPLLRADMEPARAVFEALRERPQGTPFPHLARALPWAEALLGHTREVLRAPTTRVFQNYALGSQGFEETYGASAWVATPSLLLQEDRALLSPQAAAQLMAGHRSGRWRLVAFTRRPARPPNAPQGYAPEAELALERAGLPGIPLLGQGHLALWAQRRGLNYEAVMKPGVVHPLAALLVALGTPWDRALEQAYAFLEGNGPVPQPPGGWPEVLDVVVLEDAWVGLEATGRAVQALQQAGIPVHLRALGVARDPAKRRALETWGAQVFPGPEEALRAAGVLAGG